MPPLTLHNQSASLWPHTAASLFPMLITLHLSKATVSVIKWSLFFLLSHYMANLSGGLVALSSALGHRVVQEYGERRTATVWWESGNRQFVRRS